MQRHRSESQPAEIAIPRAVFASVTTAQIHVGNRDISDIVANQEAVLDLYAAITSLNPGEFQATYDASRSRGMSGNPCTSFRWDFSDRSKVETTETATIDDVFEAPGNYVVECRVSVDATLQCGALGTEVSDALKASAMGTPFWSVSAAESRASEVVVFDASQSRDFAGCVFRVRVRL